MHVVDEEVDEVDGVWWCGGCERGRVAGSVEQQRDGGSGRGRASVLEVEIGDGDGDGDGEARRGKEKQKQRGVGSR